MSKEKIYCGNARYITTKYGDLIKLSFTKDDIKKLNDNLDKGWVNCIVAERREPSRAGYTHYIAVDAWKPEENQDKVEELPIIDDQSGDLPF